MLSLREVHHLVDHAVAVGLAKGTQPHPSSALHRTEVGTDGNGQILRSGRAFTCPLCCAQWNRKPLEVS